MSGHKFKIGQLVNYFGRGGAIGVFQITQRLPQEGDTFQYRIRGNNEPHERVAQERELRGVGAHHFVPARNLRAPSSQPDQLGPRSGTKSRKASGSRFSKSSAQTIETSENALKS
jgi:hypothetical protein